MSYLTDNCAFCKAEWPKSREKRYNMSKGRYECKACEDYEWEQERLERIKTEGKREVIMRNGDRVIVGINEEVIDKCSIDPCPVGFCQDYGECFKQDQDFMEKNPEIYALLN